MSVSLFDIEKSFHSNKGCSFFFYQVHQRTYDDIVFSKKFDLLRSTRHFGGLVYYLAKAQRIMELLEDMMAKEL